MCDLDKRELNEIIDRLEFCTRGTLRDAERSQEGRNCHVIDWTIRSASGAYKVVQELRRAFYDEELKLVMDEEERVMEELESRQEELADYVNKVHKQLFGF